MTMMIKKTTLYTVLLVGILLCLGTIVAIASGGECINNSCNTTNNFYGDEGGTTMLTRGMSDGDFAQALTQAYASGAHELDWSTTDIQISVTYALQIDGEEEDAYSFKVGKKELFGKKVLPQGMFHVTLNPEVQDLGNTVIFGGTFRIK